MHMSQQEENFASGSGDLRACSWSMRISLMLSQYLACISAQTFHALVPHLGLDDLQGLGISWEHNKANKCIIDMSKKPIGAHVHN